MQTKKTLTWQTLLRLAIGPLLLVWLLYSVGLDNLWRIGQNADPRYLLIALALYGGTILLRTVRWRVFVRAQGLQTPFHHLFLLDWVGAFFNLVLPSSVGGDIAKFYELRRLNPHANQADIASTLIADRVAGILILLWMGAVVTPLTLGGQSLVVPTLAFAGIASIGLVLLLTTRGRNWLASLPPLAWLLRRPVLHRLFHSLNQYNSNVLGRAIVAALLFNGVMIGCYMALGAAFAINLPWTAYFVIVPLLSLIQAIPLTPNGIGTREGGAVALLALFGVAQGSALALALGYFACLVAAGVVGGFITIGLGLQSLLVAKPAPVGVHE